MRRGRWRPLNALGGTRGHIIGALLVVLASLLLFNWWGAGQPNRDLGQVIQGWAAVVVMIGIVFVEWLALALNPRGDVLSTALFVSVMVLWAMLGGLAVSREREAFMSTLAGIAASIILAGISFKAGGTAARRGGQARRR